MNVLPVIDLMGGLVVRGVAGQREKYRPVESLFASNATPGSIAAGLVKQFGFSDVYVADLDAIAGAPPSVAAYDEIEAAGLNLMIDCGATTPATCSGLLRGSSRSVVLGLESVRDRCSIAEFPAALGVEAVVFSLDLKAGRPLTQLAEWIDCPPAEIAAAAIEAGFARLIALDLASVGVKQGPTVAHLCQSIRQRHPAVELISGGGVRQLDDIQTLCTAGCDRVLVASALHDGSLTREGLAELKS